MKCKHKIKCFLRWPITATAITKRNTVNKENLTNKKVLLTYKQDLLTYTEKDLLTNTNGKYPRQTPTANSCGKFLRQIPTANSRICKAEDCAEYPLCGKASHMKIKRNK